jgi:hypothetical protein
VIHHVDEFRTQNARGAGPRAHRQLVAERPTGRLAHARHLQVFAQHRGGLNIEIVERDDAVQALGPGEKRRALADVGDRHPPVDVIERVDRFAGPVGVAQLVLCQQQHAAALPAAFAQELVPFAVGRHAEQGQRHRFVSTNYPIPGLSTGPMFLLAYISVTEA